jgi:hypothetical protein
MGATMRSIALRGAVAPAMAEITKRGARHDGGCGGVALAHASGAAS